MQVQVQVLKVLKAGMQFAKQSPKSRNSYVEQFIQPHKGEWILYSHKQVFQVFEKRTQSKNSLKQKQNQKKWRWSNERNKLFVAEKKERRKNYKKGPNMREAITIEHLTSTDSLALDCVVRTKDTARCIPFIVQQFLKLPSLTHPAVSS